MLRRFLIASLIAHMALVIAVRSSEPSARQAGHRLFVNLIAQPEQTTATVIGDASSAFANHTRTPLDTLNSANTSSHTETSEAAHTGTRQVRRISKTGDAHHKNAADTVTLTAATDSLSRRAPEMAAPQPQPATNNGVSSSVHTSAVDLLQAPLDGSGEINTSVNVKERLIAALREHFSSSSYPKIARRYGWEGSVGMHLRVEADGRLSHIELVRSSGYAAIDKAALSSAQRIVTVSEAAGWLRGSYIDLFFPVEYRLNDG